MAKRIQLGMCAGVVALASIAACGGSTSDGSGGAGGVTGGSSGVTGGSGGVTGGSGGVTGGSGGVTGGTGGVTGGSGGVTGGTGGVTGGTGGTGGATGGTGGAVAAPECTSDADCKPFEDCCTCSAVPLAENPSMCKAACTETKCKQLGVPSAQVACVAGRCVKGFDCDSSKVACAMPSPACGSGEVAQVSGACWTGNCVPAEECTKVTSCSVCPGACAEYITQVGPEVHCASIPAACGGIASCACFGPTVCTAPFDTCQDLSGPMGVACGCPTC